MSDQHSLYLGLRVLMLLVLLPYNGLCFAAERQQPLSLIAAYDLAQHHDAILAAARAQRDAGMEKRLQGRAQLLPTISLDGSAYQKTTDTPAPDNYNSDGYGVSLSQPLYRQQNLSAYQQSRLQVAIAMDTYTLTEQQLIVRTASAYFAVLTAQESLVAAQAKVVAMKSSLALARRRYEVGRGIITEIDEAQARYDLARAEEIGAGYELDIAREALAKLIGPTPLEMAPVKKTILPLALQPQTRPQWEALAQQHSLSLRIARSNLELALKELKRNRAEHYPTVDLVASYHQDATQGYAPGDTDVTTTQVGIRFQLPLYAGGGTSSRVREARAKQLQAAAALRNAEEQSLLDTRQAYMSVNSGLLRLQALEQALRSSESSLQGIKRGFQVGKRTLNEVLNAQQQLFETRRELSGAKYTYLNSIMQLKAAAGVVAVADLEQINRLLGL